MSDTTNIFEESPDFDTFGGRLSRAIDASELNTKDLAGRLGVKKSTVLAWETDRSQPGSHRLTKLAGMLGVSLSWLLHGVGIGPSEASEEETAGAVGEQLARLKLLHLETGQLIGRIQGDLDRLATTGAR
ncbi:helix-turn-helix domain-containing protein [Manganibacter manganicus]|uniref:Transcriptional regulator n=1 Tax=Manganibacter manganicus TaxID=1873176 RepID=A0A1V8RRR0_9HYPH|nr:helix-turn-helix transcriptional regulator [Pseudaminobacter manganicus]OQM75814.1 transcriptional regulator [Pseudaminobacter manganicus]